MPRSKQPVKATEAPQKPARKPRATKHGNGDLKSISDVEATQQARYRAYVMSQKRTDKDVIIAVLGTALFMFVAHMFTNAWYGF